MTPGDIEDLLLAYEADVAVWTRTPDKYNYAEVVANRKKIADLLEARTPQEAGGIQPVRRWNAKYPGISMLEHNGELIRSGFGPYVLAEDYDRVASLLAEAVRMIEGYRRAGFITNPAALEQASDFAHRAGNSHHE